MPRIEIQGLTEADYQEDGIKKIEDYLREAIVSIEELKLSPEQVDFFFPRDPTITSDKVPVAIFVRMLFDKEERTPAVRNRLAQVIGKTFKDAVTWRDLAEPLEVAVPRFDPERDGFYSPGM